MSAVSELVAQLAIEKVRCWNVVASGRDIQTDPPQARGGALYSARVHRLTTGFEVGKTGKHDLGPRQVLKRIVGHGLRMYIALRPWSHIARLERRLERELAELRGQVRELRDALGG